jgi:lysophospholipase L1-like esterase
VGVYLAVGDSMSIDAYTGVDGGGAASQLARKLRLELLDLTADGNTTDGVLADLARAPAAAEVVTLTAGGNDLLFGDLLTFPWVHPRLGSVGRRPPTVSMASAISASAEWKP